jgi:hypothetical protein
MKTQRDTIAEEVIKNCMAENGFSGQWELSAYKIADYILLREQQYIDRCWICKEQSKWKDDGK